MKLKDFLYPLILSFFIVWIMNYFFPREALVQQGQRVAVPQEPVEIAPLNKEVDFVDRPDEKKVETTTVETKNGKLIFSTAAASLQKLDYVRNVDGNIINLTTLRPTSDVEREQSFFLIALNEKTPYFYRLIEHNENEHQAILVYRANVSEADIEKKYVVYKDSYKIDLELTVKPHGQVQPRIIFAGPVLTETSKPEQVAGVMEEGSSVVKYLRSRYVRELNDNFWRRPTLFGAEDRYFINAMVNDANGFAQRGYYRVEGERLFPILEGPTIDKETSWKLSFYVGPKEQEALVAVDPRLESVLDLGWFSPIVKLMLWLLLWLNSYIRSFGLAIICITIALRLCMLPLMLAIGSPDPKKSDELQKKLKYVKQKYKDDPEKLSKATEEINRKLVSGMGTGCLLPLVQVPFFIAMNRVLMSSIYSYKVPFLWIPDLSARDPYYILSIVAGLSTFYFMKGQAAAAHKQATAAIMGISTGAFSLGFSSGMTLFWITSSLFAAVQTVLQKKLKA
jgi:YidC/Oxa1 family membrane protein insertase